MDSQEYKVITSNVTTFSNRGKMQQILAEEAQAGWELAEKYNNYKIRLVRDKSARSNDEACAINPYRTEVGINSLVYMGAAAIGTLLLVYVVIQLAVLTV